MAKFDWKSIVGTVAPTLATALGGPLAGMAVKTLATQFLGNKDATEKEVEAAVMSADPQALLQLKQIDLEFQKLTTDAGIQFEKIAADDRANARAREVSTGDSWSPRILACIFVIGWFTIQWYLLRHVVPLEMREIIMRTLGTMDMALGLIMGYYFGSSASSKGKDDTIAHIAKME